MAYSAPKPLKPLKPAALVLLDFQERNFKPQLCLSIWFYCWSWMQSCDQLILLHFVYVIFPLQVIPIDENWTLDEFVVPQKIWLSINTKRWHLFFKSHQKVLPRYSMVQSLKIEHFFTFNIFEYVPVIFILSTRLCLVFFCSGNFFAS